MNHAPLRRPEPRPLSHPQFHPRLHPGRRALLAAALAALALPARPLRAQPLPFLPQEAPLDAPYFPTPQEVVEGMLKMARVGVGDMVYDLGCGDGRIVVAAARRYGARGVGIDLDPELIAEAQANARKAGVDKRVVFRLGDLFRADLSPATVVTLYLLPEVNRKLRPRLWRQLRIGTRVVSHEHHMGQEWPPERTVQVAGKILYSWTITKRQKRAAQR